VLVDTADEVVVETLEDEVEDFDVVEVGSVVEEEDEPPPPPERVPVNVELIAPTLMLEYMTYAPGSFASTVAGTPELVAHVPRPTPGVAGFPVVG